MYFSKCFNFSKSKIFQTYNLIMEIIKFYGINWFNIIINNDDNENAVILNLI